MNLTRFSSSILVVLLALALTLGAVGTALAVSFDDSGVPDAVEVGEQEEISVTIEDPFEGQPSEWTVSGDTDLDDATVVIETVTVGGDTTTHQDSVTISSEEGINKVTVRVNGEIPAIGSYNYEDPDEENILAIEIADDNAVMYDADVHRYTDDSQAAREAIDEASEAVADSNSDTAQRDLDNAITFYNSGEFESAISSANDARDAAESEGETMQMLLMVGGVVGLAAVVVGGVYFWRSRQENTNKLQ